MSVSTASPTILRSSVVMCTYNGAAFLAQQCESILGQTVLPNELIIADDGSQDGTRAIVEDFATRFRQVGCQVVLLWRQRNLGFVSNFSDALSHATGDVVFLSDQDDVWHPGKLERMIAVFADDARLTLLFTDARLVDAVGAPLPSTLFDALELPRDDWSRMAKGDAFAVLVERAVVTGATMAMRRSLIHRALPVPAGWIHDEWLATVAAMTGQVRFLGDKLIDYRQHGGNQIGMCKRTLAHRLGDMFEPRQALIRATIRRMEGLHQRLADDPDIPEQWRALLAQRRVHYAERLRIGNLPRLARPLSVWREWRAGRYQAHSVGISSVVRDLLRSR